MREKFHRLNLADRFFYAFLGFLLGLGAPAGWLVFRALSDRSDWLMIEMEKFGAFYAYSTIGTVTVFTFFGYFLGRRSDGFQAEANTMRRTLSKVSELAVTDGLTQIPNSRFLREQLPMEAESAKRYGSQLSCLMLDIDDFKSINDRFGHPVGDVVLVTLAKILRQSVRKIDIIGRLGGEEFMVLMPHTPMEMAFLIAERIRQAVQHWPFNAGGVGFGITVSIGVAGFPSKGVMDDKSLLKTADEALYEAKHSGKNRTVLSGRGIPSVC